MIGQTLSHYRITAALGAGGMGEVYRATDASGKRVPNDDGIDLVLCDDVRILGCDIDTGDDCIALFGSQRVVVTSCTMTTRSVAIRVGYDHARDIRDCVFSNLVIHDANRGLGVFVRGAGSVENLIFSDIVIRTRLLTGHWWGKGEPVHVSAVLWAPGVEKPATCRLCSPGTRNAWPSGT